MSSLFGPEFAQALLGLEPGRWHGPIPSAYGQHLVLFTERTEREAPSFDQVRDSVRAEWRAVQQRDLRERAYRAVRARYKVTVQRLEPSAPAVAAVAPSGATKP